MMLTSSSPRCECWLKPTRQYIPRNTPTTTTTATIGDAGGGHCWPGERQVMWKLADDDDDRSGWVILERGDDDVVRVNVGQWQSSPLPLAQWTHVACTTSASVSSVIVGDDVHTLPSSSSSSSSLTSLPKRMGVRVSMHPPPLAPNNTTPRSSCHVPPFFSHPLRTWTAVATWQPPTHHHHPLHVAVPLARRQQQQHRRRRMLHCHDMMGGYRQDYNPQGHYGRGVFDGSYNFAHWHLVDTFVYFSHHFVTVPPVGWVNSAHRNGVSVLGTVIVEWERGQQVLMAALAHADEFVTQLVRMTSHHGFDGWLINIESHVPVDTLPVLQRFVAQLTTAMHASDERALVLWYDSVHAATGRVEWQDELNAANEPFFAVSDGIFTNYTWKSGRPAASAAVAGGGRQYDVYTGVDVWGRGSLGGGGFDGVTRALREIGDSTSCALFAPAWTFEHESCAAGGRVVRAVFERDYEHRLWAIVAAEASESSACVPASAAASLPFVHSFSTGVGRRVYHNGRVVCEKEWLHMAQQDVTCAWLPRPMPAAAAAAMVAGRMHVARSYSTAYNGGSCVVVTNDGGSDGVCECMELLRFDAPVRASKIQVVTASSHDDDNHDDHDDDGVLSLVVGGEDDVTVFECTNGGGVDVGNGWTQYECDVHHLVRSIGVWCAPHGRAVLVGEVRLVDAPSPSPMAPTIHDLECRVLVDDDDDDGESDGLVMMVSWRQDASVEWCHVWANNKTIWCGVAYSPCFMLYGEHCKQYVSITISPNVGASVTGDCVISNNAT